MQYGKIRFSHCSGIKKVQKKCCPVAKPRQHTKNKSGFNFNILAKEIQEWTNFGFSHGQIMLLVDRAVLGGNNNGL
ncbi:MAG: hypothetical protein KH020_07430 [Clostridiales bacterium]|nr:hypothetical protein [Clostridiales bacterium]